MPWKKSHNFVLYTEWGLEVKIIAVRKSSFFVIDLVKYFLNLVAQLADCKKILLTPTFDLIRKTGLSEEEIGVLKKAVRSSFVDKVTVCRDFKVYSAII